MPIGLPMMLRHALARARALLSSPADLALLLIATLASLFAWILASPSVLLVALERASGDATLIVATLSLWLWPWLLVRPLCGGRASGGPQWHRTLPLPSLPIGFRSRVVAEAIVGLMLVLALRAAVAALAVRVFELRFHLLQRTLFAGSVAAALVSFPVLVAWLTPARQEAAYLVRSLVVAVLGLLSLLTLPGPVWLRLGLTSVGLTTLVLFAAVRPRRGARLSPGYKGALARAGLAPEARFRRDRLRRAALPVGSSFLVGLLLLFGGLLLRSERVLSTPWHPVLALQAVVFFLHAWSQPLGISVFSTDTLARSTSLFGGAFTRAWEGFPLTRESVRRSLYAHGLTIATLAAMAFAGHSLLAQALGVTWWAWRNDLIFLLMAPGAAGFLLCAAVGDRWRGTLSVAATISIPPAHLLCLGLFRPAALPPVQHLGVLAALAFLAGAPPLIHLLPRATRAPATPLRAAALLVVAALVAGVGCSRAPVESPPHTAVAEGEWTPCVPSGPTPPLPGELDADDRPARPLRLPQPAYPEAAFEARVEGTVMTEILIDAEGAVTSARLVHSVPGLDAAALSCVCRWTFEPAEANGQAVPSVAKAPVTFSVY